MSGSCYCFGMEVKHSVDVKKIIREALVEFPVRSIE
jgi:hypothetical protein